MSTARRGETAVRHGFAVVQPNFRGSHGYGIDFVLADRMDLGGGDYADCLAALDSWLAMSGCDGVPEFVTGTSYGGYLTAWAVGHTRRFVAAVAVNAVTNVESFFGQTDIPSWVYWEFGGSPLEQRELIRDRSPVQHLASVTTPTLVVHSEEDRRVPIAQGLELHALLQAAGVATGFVRYPREYHRISEPAHRVDLISRTLDWFFRSVGDRHRPKRHLTTALVNCRAWRARAFALPPRCNERYCLGRGGAGSAGPYGPYWAYWPENGAMCGIVGYIGDGSAAPSHPGRAARP